MFRARLILGLLLGVTVAAGADTAGYYSNPARDIEFSNVQHLGRSPRIVLPAVYLRFARWGRIPLNIAGSSSEGAVVDVDSPVPVETLRELADRLRADLAGKLKEAGWEVLLTDDIKSSPSWSKLPRLEADKRFGVPLEQGNVGGNPRRYLIVTPANVPVITAGATGPAWAMKELVTELNATVLVATYTVEVIPVVTAGGVAPVTPHLQLLDINFDFRTPGMVGGTIRAKVPQMSADESGRFSIPGLKDESRRAKALEEAAAGRGKGELAMEAETNAFVTTGVAVAGEFNAKAVQTISVYAPK